MSVPQIISRREALRRGLTRYFTGKPCKRGHIAERVGGHCVQCEAIHSKRRKRKPLNGEQRRRASELAAQRRREVLGTEAPRRRLFELGLTIVMDSKEARERSEYLNRKIRTATGLD